MLRTLMTGAVGVIMNILLSPIAVAAHVLRYDEENSSVQQWCMHTWARAICWAGGVKVVLHGAEHIVPGQGVVYVSNHVSWFDVFAICKILPKYTFVAKAELRRIPFFGWGAEGAGIVFMSRGDRKQAFEVYDEIAARVKNGLCVVVFPEGTRSRSYSLGSFKKGPFVLAIAAGAPIIPLVVYGTREVMPKGAWRVRSNTVHVHLLPPVETAGYGYEHRHELTRIVWQNITDTLRDVYGEGSIGDADATARLERLA